MRRRILLLAAAATSLAGIGFTVAPEAEAVCGGGLPGEPCYCPPYSVDTSNGIKNVKLTPVYC